MVVLMEDEIYEDLEANFDKAFSALRREIARVRSGRANVNLLDNIKVPYYGQPTPLAQVAALQVPEPRMITIKPWEKTMVKEIERAIQQSDLGLNPMNDGILIRLVIPALTEERRKKLARQVQQNGENAKISARNSRRDANAMLKAIQKDSEITEDDLARALNSVQDRTDSAIKKIDDIVSKKEAELLEI
jgi:ribosome recycling factor